MGDKKKLIIVGAGGFGCEALWVSLEMNKQSSTASWDILGFCVEYPKRRGGEIMGFRILGTPEDVLSQFGSDIYFHCAIGDNQARSRVAERLEGYGWKAATLIHPSVVIAPETEVLDGSYVGAGSILAPFACIGRHVLINTCVGIGHHSLLEDYCQISPGARVNGFCHVMKFAYIGSNASLEPGVIVGENAKVGANSYVVKSVKNDVTVIGIPARTIQRGSRS